MTQSLLYFLPTYMQQLNSSENGIDLYALTNIFNSLLDISFVALGVFLLSGSSD